MTKIIQRHDTAANWTSVNPVLAAGEMGVETDTNKFKFGDGVTAWSGLAYAAGEGGSGSGTTLTSTDGTTTYSKLALGDKLVVIPPDIPWTNPQMTSNSQDGYVASASVSSSSTGSAIWKAFNKDTTSSEDCWYTGSVSMPQWIMLECPEPVRLTSCMIANEVATPVNFKSGYIQGSNDGNTFDTLYTITDRPDTTGLKETYTFTNDVYYKYLRVYCTASYGSGLSIQEIEFSGFTKDATAVSTLNVDAYTKTETDSLLSGKQDKLTAVEPLYIEERVLGTLTQDWYLNSDKIATPTAIKSGGSNNNSKNYYPYGEQKLESDKDINIQLTYITSNGSYDGARFYFEWAMNRGYILFDMNSSYSGRVIPISVVGIDNAGNSYNICSFSEVEHGVLKRLTFNWYNATKQWYFKIENVDTGNIKTEQSGTADYSLTSNITTKPRIYSNCVNSSTSSIVNTILYTDTLKLSYSDNKSLVIGNNYTPSPATTSSLGVVQPDGTSITVSETGVISGQDVKTFTGYSDTGTLVLKSINGVLQWVAEA